MVFVAAKKPPRVFGVAESLGVLSPDHAEAPLPVVRVYEYEPVPAGEHLSDSLPCLLGVGSVGAESGDSCLTPLDHDKREPSGVGMGMDFCGNLAIFKRHGHHG
jgi:hypothetical protein